MKKLLLAVLALAMVLSLGSCVFFDGDIYGSISTDTTYDNYSVRDLGGFPGTGYYLDTYYRVYSGTYRVRYNEVYNGQYWPGNEFGTGGLDSNMYWNCSYSVDGRISSDQYFNLYLTHNGLYFSGVDNSNQYIGREVVDRPGTYTFEKDGLTITVTTTIEKGESDDSSAPTIRLISK